MANRSRITLADLSPKYQAQAFAQLANGEEAAQPAIIEAEASQRRIRQSRGDKLNKLEAAFFEVAKKEHGDDGVIPQRVRVRLGNGHWYKPDFFVPAVRTFFEVKGPKAFRGGLENLKAAASLHTWARFILVWREGRTGPWLKQEVLP